MKQTSIKYDEEKLALEILSNKSPKMISARDAGVLCRYYYDLGLDTKKVRKKIYEFYSMHMDINSMVDNSVLDSIIQRNKLLVLKKSANIPITKKEMEVLKKLSHKDYKIAVYILFIVKLEKFQNIKKKDTKLRSFKYLLWHDIRSCALSVGISLSEQKSKELLHRLYEVGFAEPTLLGDYRRQSPISIICADSSNGKNIEMVIEGKKDFLSQLKYFCVSCGKQAQKSKMHDFCQICYKEKRKTDKKNWRGRGQSGVYLYNGRKSEEKNGK